MRFRRNTASSAFTLLELLTVIVIITILAILIVPMFDRIRAQVEKVRCSGNLRQLYLGADSYVRQNGHWPQIDASLLKSQSHEYDEAWIQMLIPFGLSRDVWICPTVQRGYGQPDYKLPENRRSDYLAMPFDDKQQTPYRWRRSPWFAEKGDMHGNGNLIIFTDGSILAAKDVRSGGSGE